MNRIPYVAWLLLLIAISAWVGVGFFAWTIAGDENDRAVNLQAAQQSSTKQASAVRTHAIAGDTAQARTRLGALFAIDVISVVDMIDAVGKASGVSMKLRDTLPENAPAGGTGSLAVKAVAFVIEADGKFPALMHAAQLFETLPIPSSLVRLDIEHTPNSAGAGASSWHMNASIRVLTTSNISS